MWKLSLDFSSTSPRCGWVVLKDQSPVCHKRPSFSVFSTFNTKIIGGRTQSERRRNQPNKGEIKNQEPEQLAITTKQAAQFDLANRSWEIYLQALMFDENVWLLISVQIPQILVLSYDFYLLYTSAPVGPALWVCVIYQMLAEQFFVLCVSASLSQFTHNPCLCSLNLYLSCLLYFYPHLPLIIKVDSIVKQRTTCIHSK